MGEDANKRDTILASVQAPNPTLFRRITNFTKRKNQSYADCTLIPLFEEKIIAFIRDGRAYKGDS